MCAARRRLTRRSFLAKAAARSTAAGVSAFAAARLLSAADAPPTASPDSWPNFRNGLQLHGIAHTSLSDSPALKWERDAEDGCKSTPAIVGEFAYVGQLSGDLQALRLSDGEPQWTYRSLVTDNPKEFIPGFNGPVTVSDDVVICGDEEGTLHCVDRATGKPRWRFDAGGLIVGGAAVIDDRVVCGSHSQFLYGVHLETGEKLWEFNCRGPVNGTQAFDGDLTFVSGCSEPVLYVVDTKTGAEHSQVQLEDLLIATPALVDGILYFGTSEGLVLAVDWREKKTVARFETRQPREMHSAPAVTDDLVVVGARDKSVYGLDRKTLQQRWAFSTRAANDGSPVVVGDRVYIGSGDKNLYGLSLAGQEVWKYSAGAPFADASPAIAQGRMVVCTEGPNGKIACFG